MSGSTTAMSVAGWRFAQACCAAQPVCRARRRSAVLRSAPSSVLQAVEALRLNGSQTCQQLPVQSTTPNQRAAALRTPQIKALALGRPYGSNDSCVPYGFFPSHQCWLTCRSTGPIAAGRHLGYKSLAQIPAHRNRPVSFDVRPHRSQTVDHHLRQRQSSRAR